MSKQGYLLFLLLLGILFCIHQANGIEIPGEYGVSGPSHSYERRFQGALCDGMFGASSFVSNQPNHLFLYNETELYFTDRFTYSIKKINLQTRIVSVIVGTGIYEKLAWTVSNFNLHPKETNIGTPTSVAVSKGIVYFTTLENNDLIFTVPADGSGIVDKFAGIPGSTGFSEATLITNATLSSPTFLNVYPNGNLLFYESGICTIRMISGKNITTVAGIGACGGGILGNGISAMTLSTKDVLYVATSSGTILKWGSTTSGFVTVSSTGASIRSLAVTADAIYFTSRNGDLSFLPTSGVVNKTSILGPALGFTQDGQVIPGQKTDTPYALAIGKTNTLYFSEIGNYRIRSYAGSNIRTIVGFGAANSSIDYTALVSPKRMAIMGSQLYVTDSDRLTRIDVPTGNTISLTTIPGVSSIAVYNDMVYVASTSSNMVFLVESANTRRVSGNGTDSSTGDGGPAIYATISRPVSLAVSSNGDLYILSSDRLRRVSDGIISTIFFEYGNGFNDIFISPMDEILISNVFGQIYRLTCSRPLLCTITRVAGKENTSARSLGFDLATNVVIEPIVISALVNVKTGYWNNLLISEVGRLSVVKEGFISGLMYNPKNSALTSYMTITVDGIAVNQTSGVIYISGPYGISTLTPYILPRELCPCSGNGVCYSIDPNTCLCDSAYSGNNCEIPSCGRIQANSSLACNSHGKCTSLDTCTCQSGFVGKYCQIPFCIGSTLTENFTCSEQSTINNSTKSEVIVEVIATASELNSKNLTFSTVDNVGVVFPANFSGDLSKSQDNNAAITLVSSVVDSTSNQNSTSSSQPIPTATQVVSAVITLSLFTNSSQKISVKNLEKPIELLFSNIQIPKNSDISNYTCMFFDTIINDWSEEGISSKIVELIGNSQTNIVLSIKCETKHLTSFAVIDRNFKKQATTPGGGGIPTTSELRNEIVGLSETAIIAISVSIGGSCLILMSLVFMISIVCVIVMKKKKANKRF